MLTSNNSEISLNKAEMSAATGPTKGPGSKPRGGKYIRRWWENDHWEYEYQDSPHPSAHGPGAIHEEEHTLQAPVGAEPGIHSPEQAYQSARVGHLGLGGAKQQVHQATHPVTGEPIEFRVKPSNNKAHKHGIKIEIRVPQKDAQGNPVLDAKGRPKMKTDKTAGSWAAVERWAHIEKHSQKAMDEQGNVLYEMFPNAGAIDLEKDVFVPVSPDKNRQFKIKFSKLAPEYVKGGNANQIYARTADEGRAKMERLRRNASRQIASRNNAPILLQIRAGAPATQLLEEGRVPLTNKNNKSIGVIRQDPTKLRPDFQSQNEKLAFLAKIAEENQDIIDKAAARTGEVVDPLTQINDPTSSVHRAVDRAVRGFNPETSRQFAAYLMGSLLYEFRQGEAARQAQSLEGLQEQTGGVIGAQEAEQPDILDEEAFMNRVEAELHQINIFKDLQEQKLQQFSQQYPQYAAISNFLAEPLNTMGSSEAVGTSLEDQIGPFQQRMEQVVNSAAPQEKQILSMLAISNDEWAQAVTKSFCYHENTNDTLKKSVAAINVFMALNTDPEFLQKAELPAYSHREGNDQYPKYYFRDDKNNYLRFTNAPNDHEDVSNVFGESEIHPLELNSLEHPQFFTPDGRKLTRAPYTDAPVEWNPSYHPNDPKNLWAARWVNPVSGSHEYSYIDSDIRDQEKFYIHQQNVLLDNRLPIYRQYVSALFKSHFTKDKVVAVMLMLLDQGKFRLHELAGARVADLISKREMVSINGRIFHTDPAVKTVLASLAANRNPWDPLFAIPRVYADGQIDPSIYRRLGPHMLVNVMESLGVPLEALQTYHATQTYSVEIQKIFEENNCSWPAAHHFAVLEVAAEMGHDLDFVPDYEQALVILEQTLIDPVVVESIKNNVNKLGFGAVPSYLKRSVYPSIPHVSSNLLDKTESEQEFSKWLHTYPFHLHAEEKTTIYNPA